MTNTLTGISNAKTVADFVATITKHLTTANKSWMRVATDFAEAEDQLSKKQFKELLKDTRFSYSTVRKLIKIANSDRIKQNAKQLVLIDAWSTLHEIVKLDDEQFENLSSKFFSGKYPQFFKRSDVTRIKNGICAASEKKLPIFGMVRVDVSKINSSEDFDTIKNALTELASNPLVQIDFTDLEERLQAQQERQIEKEMEGVVRAARSRLKDVVKCEKAKLPRRNRKNAFVTRWGFSDEEIFNPEVNPNDMLERFGHERFKPEIVDSHF